MTQFFVAKSAYRSLLQQHLPFDRLLASFIAQPVSRVLHTSENIFRGSLTNIVTRFPLHFFCDSSPFGIAADHNAFLPQQEA
jgi:hypothetical protein